MFEKKNTGYLQYSALVIILIIATFLRFFKLNYQSLWLDEIYSIVPADPKWPVSMIIEYCKKDQPPAYFLSLHYWFNYFPYTDFSARLFSATIGVLGVLAMFFLGKQLKDTNTGLFASFITAINYFHIYYSQEVRFYSLLFLLTVLSYLFFLNCCKRHIVLNYLGYCLVSTALIYTHYYGMIVLLTQFVIFWLIVWKGEKNWKFIIYSLISGIIIIVLYQPWIPIIIKDSNIDPTLMWIPTPKEFFILEYLYNYFGKDPYQFALFFMCTLILIKNVFYSDGEKLILNKSNLSKPLIIFICVILILWKGTHYLRAIVPHAYVHVPLAIVYMILFCILLFKLPSKLFAGKVLEIKNINLNIKATFLILSVWGIMSYLIPYVRSLTSTPMLVDRYTIISLPVIFMVFALGLRYIHNIKILFSLICLLVSSTFLNFAFFNKHYFSYHKGQFREAAEQVVKHNKSHSKVFSTLAWHYNFYFDQFKADVDVIDPNSVDFGASIANEKQIWVLVGHRVVLTAEQIRLIDRDFQLKHKYSYYGGAYAEEYVRK